MINIYFWYYFFREFIKYFESSGASQFGSILSHNCIIVGFCLGGHCPHVTCYPPPHISCCCLFHVFWMKNEGQIHTCSENNCCYYYTALNVTWHFGFVISKIGHLFQIWDNLLRDETSSLVHTVQYIIISLCLYLLQYGKTK